MPFPRTGFQSRPLRARMASPRALYNLSSVRSADIIFSQIQNFSWILRPLGGIA